MIGRIATITADLGAEAPLDCVTLLSTMRGAVAMVQARLSNVANFSATLADTGLLKAEAPNQRRDMLRRLDAARDTLERAGSHGFTQPALILYFSSIFTRSDDSI